MRGMPFSCSTMDSTRGKSNDFPCVTASGFEFRARSGGQGARLPDPARRAVAPHSDQPPPKVGHGSQENGDWTNGLSQHALLREKITPSQSRNQEAEEETGNKSRPLNFSLKIHRIVSKKYFSDKNNRCW